jgi:hypothetical protein
VVRTASAAPLVCRGRAGVEEPDAGAAQQEHAGLRPDLAAAGSRVKSTGVKPRTHKLTQQDVLDRLARGSVDLVAARVGRGVCEEAQAGVAAADQAADLGEGSVALSLSVRCRSSASR